MGTNAATFRGDSVTRIPLDMIGGGRVVRAFYNGKERMKVGAELSGEYIRSLSGAHRQAMLGRFISVWPRSSESSQAGFASRSDDAEGAEGHVVPLGFGRYDVVRGVKVNAEPIEREEAYTLAGKPMPKKAEK